MGLLAFHLFYESLGGLEARQVVGGNGDRGVLANVAGCLGSAMLDDEAAETAEIYVLFLVEHATLYALHEALHYCGHFFLLQSCLLSNLTDDICFCHGVDILFFYYMNVNVLALFLRVCKVTSFSCDTEIYCNVFFFLRRFCALDSSLTPFPLSKGEESNYLQGY